MKLTEAPSFRSFPLYDADLQAKGFPPDVTALADAIQSATGGPLGGARMQYHLRQAMIFLNAFSFGTPEIFVGQAPTKFDEKTLELKDEVTKKLVAQQLAGFAKFIERVKA